MITPGLYVPTDIGNREFIWHRYVIAEFNGMVAYSRGGDRNFSCKSATFENWIKRWKCKRAVLDGNQSARQSSPEEQRDAHV